MKRKMKASDAVVYAEYLCAFAVVRSGGRLEELVDFDERCMAARALGANDGIDHEYLPTRKWAVLEAVEDMLSAQKRDREPCKVVTLGEKEMQP